MIVAVPDIAPAASVGTQARELDAAFRQLGRLWNLNLGAGEPCVAAQRQKLHCFTSNSSLSEIRSLDRPGILTLHDDEDRKYYGVLTGLGSQGATLRIGQRTERVTLAALARRWHGVYRTFWHGPDGAPRALAIGASGADVDWMAARLARLDNLPPPTTSARFDDAMRARVREFQVAQGLAPDGIPGAQTLMRLASAADGGEPRLLSDDKAGPSGVDRIDPPVVVRPIPPLAAKPAGS